MHWNVTGHPTQAWVWRQVIAATSWGVRPRFLIRDRDRAYGGDFVPRARRIGIETVLTPVRAPQANAIAERVIRTIRQERLDHVIVINERHLRRLLGEFVPYDTRSRPHRSLDLEPPDGFRVRVRPPGAPLNSHPLLSPFHHVY